jgi:hypothetical protein
VTRSCMSSSICELFGKTLWQWHSLFQFQWSFCNSSVWLDLCCRLFCLLQHNLLLHYVSAQGRPIDGCALRLSYNHSCKGRILKQGGVSHYGQIHIKRKVLAVDVFSSSSSGLLTDPVKP